MSEKIYACLLRLFPSSFRKHYEEESLRLLRERLRDERGVFRRLRLNFDLIADILGGLPQAYRNSYAEAAPVALLTPYFDGVPSFRVLQKEPIRRIAIVVAGALSLTVLVVFPYVMDRSIRYRPAALDGPISPIESVLQRVNRPISPDSVGISPNSANGVRSNTPETASADPGRRDARSVAKPNAAFSTGTKSAASAASPPARSGEQKPIAIYSDQGSSYAVAVPSSSPAPKGQPFAQSQPERTRSLTQSANPSNTQDPAPAAVSTNVSGRWTVSLRVAGKDVDLPQWFIFKQESAELTGTGGPDSTKQYRIVHGLVAGDSVKFELNNGRKRFLYDLKVEEKELRGILSIKSANEIRNAEVWLERAP
jgi:hypothetical protein